MISFLLQLSYLISLRCEALEPQRNTLSIWPRDTASTDDSGKVDFDWFMAELEHTLVKYGATATIPTTPDSRSARGILRHRANTVTLSDDYYNGTDQIYYGDMRVGDESRNLSFDVLFDTGSFETFIPGPGCQGCTGSVRYDQAGTYQGVTTTVSYGSGTVKGRRYYDSVTVAGLTAHNQSLISLTNATGLTALPIVGIVGMGYRSSTSTKAVPFFNTLVNERTLSDDQKQFSFYTGRARRGTGNMSELAFGTPNERLYIGSFIEKPVVGQTYWQLAISGATVNGHDIVAPPSNSSNAIIDTGSALILAPPAIVQQIYADVRGAQAVPIRNGTNAPIMYSFPCHPRVDVRLLFSNTSFAIDPLDFSVGRLSSINETHHSSASRKQLYSKLLHKDEERCLGGIVGAQVIPNSQTWIVGDTFLKNWYTTFASAATNALSIRFAKAV